MGDEALQALELGVEALGDVIEGLGQVTGEPKHVVHHTDTLLQPGEGARESSVPHQSPPGSSKRDTGGDAAALGAPEMVLRTWERRYLNCFIIML